MFWGLSFSPLFFPAIPFENFTADCGRAWLLSSVAEAASKRKKDQKNDTDCKYILPKETYEINRSGCSQLANCLLILHHPRAYGFSNHYFGCSWNTKHILQKHYVQSSLRRIAVLYQNRITKTVQSALFGFCVKYSWNKFLHTLFNTTGTEQML